MIVRPAKPVSDSAVKIEYPSQETVYLASSDIVVSGTAMLFGEKIFIDLQDIEDVAKSFGEVSTGDEGSGGAWATRLLLRSNRRSTSRQLSRLSRFLDTPDSNRFRSRSLPILPDRSCRQQSGQVSAAMNTSSYSGSNCPGSPFKAPMTSVPKSPFVNATL